MTSEVARILPWSSADFGKFSVVDVLTSNDSRWPRAADGPSLPEVTLDGSAR